MALKVLQGLDVQQPLYSPVRLDHKRLPSQSQPQVHRQGVVADSY